MDYWIICMEIYSLFPDLEVLVEYE